VLIEHDKKTVTEQESDSKASKAGEDTCSNRRGEDASNPVGLVPIGNHEGFAIVPSETGNPQGC